MLVFILIPVCACGMSVFCKLLKDRRFGMRAVPGTNSYLAPPISRVIFRNKRQLSQDLEIVFRKTDTLH